MIPSGPVGQEYLLELRRAFDQSFAAPAGRPSESLLSLIAIQVGGEAVAIRADQITGIARCRQIVPLPSRIPESLGITGIRGVLVPVFSLAALLGKTRGEECSWMALTQPEAPVALAFDEFESQLEVRRTSCYEDESTGQRRHVRQLVRVGASIRPVIDIPSVLEAIRTAAARSRS